MPKLTKKIVDATIKTAVAEKREIVATCSVLAGFYVRVKPSGIALYNYRYRWNGERHRIPLGKHGGVTADRARELAEGHHDVLRHGEDPRAKRKAAEAAPTMDRLADEYMERHAKPHKKSWKKDETRLRLYVRPELGALRVDAVTREQVRALLRTIGIEQEKPGAANKVLALLSKMFSAAIEWEYRLDNPCKGLTRSAGKGGAKYPSKDVHRYLQPDEIRALLVALDGLRDRTAAAALRWILMTGARHDEALGLRWSEVDKANCRVHLRDTKTGAQWRPVSKAALAVVAKLPRPEVGDAYAFPSPRSLTRKRSSLYAWWRIALKAAKIGGCRIHDLRHTAASLAAANGASLSQIGAMLGHKSPQATYMYSHLVDADIRQVASGVATVIAKAEASKPKVVRLKRLRK